MGFLSRAPASTQFLEHEVRVAAAPDDRERCKGDFPEHQGNIPDFASLFSRKPRWRE
jgi:hypothetical protein